MIKTENKLQAAVLTLCNSSLERKILHVRYNTAASGVPYGRKHTCFKLNYTAHLCGNYTETEKEGHTATEK